MVLSSANPLTLFYRERQRDPAGDWQSYFDEGPFIEQLGGESGGYHQWNPAHDELTTVQWMHTLGHLLTAVAQSGLRITDVVEGPDGAEVYGIAGGPCDLFIRATKDERGTA